MPMVKSKKPDEIRVFYAWQSDLPAKFTRTAIRNSLNAAIAQIGNNEEGAAYGKAIILDEAKQLIESWRREYNESRPHRSLGERTPSEFASQIAASRDLAEA